MAAYQTESPSPYKLVLSTKANEDFDAIYHSDRKTAKIIDTAIKKIGHNPKLKGSRKLEPKNKNRYRYRVSGYRILYTFGQQKVKIQRIVKRNDAYKKSTLESFED